MRYRRVFPLLLVLIILTGCATIQPRFDRISEDRTGLSVYSSIHTPRTIDAELFKNSLFSIYVFGSGVGIHRHVGSGKVYIEPRHGTFAQRGTGFAYNGYIITAGHVVVPRQVNIPLSRYTYYVAQLIRITSMNILVGIPGTFMYSGTVLYVDEAIDIAVIGISTTYTSTIQSIPFDPIETFQYKVSKGDRVAMVRLTRGDQGEFIDTPEIIYGYVVDEFNVLSPQKSSIPFFFFLDIATDLTAMPGDSGSPVFCLIGNRYYLIGIATKMFSCCNGKVRVLYCARIDSIYSILAIPYKWFMEVQ